MSPAPRCMSTVLGRDTVFTFDVGKSGALEEKLRALTYFFLKYEGDLSKLEAQQRKSSHSFKRSFLVFPINFLYIFKTVKLGVYERLNSFFF